MYKNNDNVTHLTKNIQKQIKLGTITIESKLDLHGYGISDAFDSLIQFINDNYNRSKRNLLVITGKGLLGSTDSIKHNFKYWMQSHYIAPYVLCRAKAHVRHGGAGAYYVILKKNR